MLIVIFKGKGNSSGTWPDSLAPAALRERFSVGARRRRAWDDSCMGACRRRAYGVPE
jgi:hypothetical protein